MKSQIEKARIGQISYTNCLPFYHHLPLEEAECLKAVPTELNAAMQRGEIDMGPISSLEYLLHPENYYILPGVAIGARDFSGSVILFSHEKIEGLDKAAIAVSKESLSSVTLLKVLLKFKYKFENDFVSVPSHPEEMLKKHKAALVIGDDALFYKPKEFVYKYDLAELWWNWTEKPFCFALWAVRRAFADRHPDEVASFSRKLQKNLTKNLQDMEKLIKESLGMTFMDDNFPKIFGYLFNLSYGLDADMQDGLELFYRLATRLKIAVRPAPLVFFQNEKRKKS